MAFFLGVLLSFLVGTERVVGYEESVIIFDSFRLCLCLRFGSFVWLLLIEVWVHGIGWEAGSVAAEGAAWRRLDVRRSQRERGYYVRLYWLDLKTCIRRNRLRGNSGVARVCVGEDV